MTAAGSFELGWRDVAACLVEPVVVEQVDVVESGDLDLLGIAPGSAGLDEHGVVKRTTISYDLLPKFKGRRYSTVVEISAGRRTYWEPPERGPDRELLAPERPRPATSWAHCDM